MTRDSVPWMPVKERVVCCGFPLKTGDTLRGE